jgi:hypothetical protein
MVIPKIYNLRKMMFIQVSLTTGNGMARKVLICDNPNFSGSPSNGVKDCYGRLTDTGAEAERRVPGGAESPGDANAPGPVGEEAKAARGPGAVGAGRK